MIRSVQSDRTAEPAAGGDSIASVEAFACRVPLPEPLAIGSARVAERHYTVVRVRCESGLEGAAYAFSRGLPVGALVEDLLAPVAVGLDARHTEGVRRALLAAYWPSSEHATFTTAVSALDLALWDVAGRRAGLPVAELLGRHREGVPICLVAGYRTEDDEALAAELATAVALGAASVKLVVGGGPVARDARRLRAVREAIGDDALLAVDAFRSFADLDDAVRRMRALADFDLAFVEDPFAESLAPLIPELRRRTDMSIALGESLAGHRAIRALIDAGAVDLVRLDATVIGGVREFLAGAALASAHGMPIATHVNAEIHVHLALAQDNLFRGGLEYLPPDAGVDALHRLVHAPLRVRDGLALAPTTPGLGLDFDWDAVRAYADAR